MHKLLLITLVFTLSTFTSSCIILAQTKTTTMVDEERFKGRTIIFDYKGHDKERDIAYEFLCRSIGTGGGFDRGKPKMGTVGRHDLGIALLDIDSDGVDEILIYLNGKRYNRDMSGGLLKIIKPPLTPMIGTKRGVTARENIKVLDSKHMNHNDLLMFYKSGEPKEIYRWNGSEYDVAESFKDIKERITINKVENMPGDMVVFDYQNYPKERQIAYQYYLDTRNESTPELTREDMGIYLYDLDNDGQKEILLYIDAKDMCPRAGCTFATIKPAGDTYKRIIWEKGITLGIQGRVKVLKNNTNNYHDIVTEADDKWAMKWKWDGKYYEGDYVDDPYDPDDPRYQPLSVQFKDIKLD